MSAATTKSQDPHEHAASEPKSDERVVHSVDGIEEYDNELPRWWLYSLFATMVFAAGYWFVYQNAFADSPLETYQREVAKSSSANAAVTPEALAALVKSPAAIDQGKGVFTQTCVACHRNDGGGLVGPNLTDDFWIHGSTPERIYETVAKGVPDKGMPAWGSQLGSERVQAVTAYLVSIRGTNVAGGKAPQGDREVAVAP